MLELHEKRFFTNPNLKPGARRMHLKSAEISFQIKARLCWHPAQPAQRRVLRALLILMVEP